MAQPDPIPQPALTSVAQQLGQFLAVPAAARPFALAAGPQLAESLAVCTVGADQVANPPADLAVLAEPSGFWHHQVRTAAGPTHMAMSQQQGFTPAGLDVQQIVESPIAGQLDRAMAWVDRTIPQDDVTVRLLLIPAYYVHALLLIRGKRYSAVLVSQPDGFTRLQYEQEYPLRDFLKRLAKEQASGTLT